MLIFFDFKNYFCHLADKQDVLLDYSSDFVDIYLATH